MNANALSPKARFAAARARADAGIPVRLAMRGVSMLPMFREPMILEIERLDRPARVGDVLVFEDGQKYIVHRVVRVEGDTIVTSGDAQPHVVERVAPDQVLGRVERVYASDEPKATRVDRSLFRFRGAYYAKAHQLRASFHRAMPYARAASPFVRERATVHLCRALRAVLQADRESFIRSCSGISEANFAHAARHHRCAALIERAISDFGLAQHARFEAISAILKRAVWGTAMNAARMRAQLRDVVHTFKQAGIEIVLLKGAARQYTGEPGADLHSSCDIDVMVDIGDQDVAVNALYLAGYRQRAGSSQRDYYLRRHHHAAPLSKPGCNPVEVHVALAPPGRISSETTLRTMRSFCEPVEDSVLRFDHPGNAFHLAVHGIGALSMRDAFLIASDMRAMTQQERERLAALVANETKERLRINGILFFCAQLAGVEWAASPAERLYAGWLLRQADIPRFLRGRAQLVESSFATVSGGMRHGWRTLTAKAGALQFAGRICSGVSALGYAMLLRRA